MPRLLHHPVYWKLNFNQSSTLVWKKKQHPVIQHQVIPNLTSNANTSRGLHHLLYMYVLGWVRGISFTYLAWSVAKTIDGRWTICSLGLPFSYSIQSHSCEARVLTHHDHGCTYQQEYNPYQTRNTGSCQDVSFDWRIFWKIAKTLFEATIQNHKIQPLNRLWFNDP